MNGTDTDADQFILSVETRNNPLDDDMVITPGAPVKFDPVRLKLCANVEPMMTDPKLGRFEAFNTAPEGVLPQITTGLALLRGAGVAVLKSALLLSVSSQPLLFLKAASMALSAGIAVVSEQLAVPYPTISIY